MLEEVIGRGRGAPSGPAGRLPRGRSSKKPATVDQWKSLRPVGKRPLNPLAETTPRQQMNAICNKLSESNYAVLKDKIMQCARDEPDMVVSTILGCMLNNGYYLRLYAKAVAAVQALNPAAVTPQVDAMCATFVDERRYALKDDVNSDDYDVFCCHLAEKRRRLTTFEFLYMSGRGGEMGAMLPEMIAVLGDPGSAYSKDMIIDMLGIHHCFVRRTDYNDTGRAYERFICDSVSCGIDTKCKFKMLDLMATVKRQGFA
jgi:hypothetical protein